MVVDGCCVADHLAQRCSHLPAGTLAHLHHSKIVVGEEVPVVAEEVVEEEPELEVPAYSSEMTVAGVVGVVPAAVEEAEVRQVLAALAEEVDRHSRLAAVVEYLRAADRVVDRAAEEDLAAGVAVADARGLRHKAFGFHRGPFVGRHGLSESLCGVQ